MRLRHQALQAGRCAATPAPAGAGTLHNDPRPDAQRRGAHAPHLRRRERRGGHPPLRRVLRPRGGITHAREGGAGDRLEVARVDTTGSITRSEPLLDTPFPFDPPNLSAAGARDDPPLCLRWSTPEGARVRPPANSAPGACHQNARSPLSHGDRDCPRHVSLIPSPPQRGPSARPK